VKNKIKFFVSLFLMVGLLIYIFMTPKGALRLGIAMSGHPVKAVTSTITNKPYDFYSKKNQIGYSLKNPPYNKDTDSKLINWNVTRYGIFYVAEYFGEG